MRWPKYWSFSFSISPSKEHPGLISFRMDWLHLLAVQGTLKSLLQHHRSKASILRCSAFFTVQLSHPYSHIQLFATLWTTSHQAPLSLGFSRHEYWSGLPCPPPGGLPPKDGTHVSWVSCIGRQVLYNYHHLGSPGCLTRSLLNIKLFQLTIQY